MTRPDPGTRTPEDPAERTDHPGGSYGGYLPTPHGLHAEFFRLAASTGRVHLQRCRDCRRVRHPPRHYCAACGSDGWDFVPTANGGTVYSAVVAHRAFGPAPVPELPYVAVVVELREGPRILGTGHGSPPADWVIGRPVRIDVHAVGEAFAAFRVVLDGR